MATSTRAAPVWSSLLLSLLLWVCVEAAPSIPMDYCATINTATMAANTSIYQSDGLCNTFCAPQWALAIVHDDSCWCSNFVPSKSAQVAISQCNKPCPGFPDDVCGGEGVYGYMLLNNKPSGTVGSGQPAPSQSSPSPSQTGDDSESTTPPTPQITTVTTGGQTKTITVTPTNTPSSPLAGGASLDPRPEKHGLSAGAAAGIAVAVIVAFLFVSGMLGWMFLKRRRAAREEDEAGSTAGTGALGFSSKRGSSAGISSSTPRTGEMSETRYYMNGGPGAAGMGMGGGGHTDASTPPDPARRRSTLMPVDPRLDPFAKGIYNRAENKSHDSVNTIRDDHDYSRKIQDPPRVLRAMNPDSDID